MDAFTLVLIPATLAACVLLLIDADPHVRNLFTRRHK